MKKFGFGLLILFLLMIGIGAFTKQPGSTAGNSSGNSSVTKPSEDPEEPTPELPVHPDENHDGICDDCGEDIFANATYSVVNAGDAISEGEGWYRLSSLGWDFESNDFDFSIGDVTIKLSYGSFTYEMVSGDEPVSVEEVGDRLITITAQGHCMVNDVMASASIKYTGTENVVKGFIGGLQLTFNKYGVFIRIEGGIQDYINGVEFSFSGVRLVESSHQLEKVHH